MKFKEDMKKGLWFAVKEWWFGIHSGRKTYIACLGSIALNYYLSKHGCDCWIFVISTEYFVIEMCKKHAYEVDL